jgi:hypothetical protein
VRMTTFRGYAARDGRFVPRAGVMVYFSDGRRWNSADANDPQRTVEPALLSLLRQKMPVPLDDSMAQPER